MDSAPDDRRHRCPSVPARVGVELIGVAQPDGRVGFLETPMRVDREFLDVAESYGPTGNRFRFSAGCEQNRCVHWTGTECGLINRLRQRVNEAASVPDVKRLPSCGIRCDCRWWAQHGAEACKVCVLVATDRAAANEKDRRFAPKP